MTGGPPGNSALTPGETPAPRPGANEALGYLFAFLTAVVASVAFITAKPVLDHLDPLSFSVSQFGLATLFSLLWLALNGETHLLGRVTPGQWLFLTVVALLFLAAVYTMWIGLSRVPPTTAALLNRLEVFVAVFLGMALLGDRLTRREALGGLVTLLGVLVLRFQAPPDYGRGFWMLVLSATLFGLIQLMVKVRVHQIPPRVFVFVRNALAFVFFLVAAGWRVVMREHAGWGGLVDWDGVWTGLPLIAATALCGPVLARTTFSYALLHLDISRASLVQQTQPVFVAALSSIFLLDLPARREWTGGILIVVGCLLLVQWHGAWRRRGVRPTVL